MNNFTGLKALRKTIELLLQKLNMSQERMNELSREELLEIMANENLDLSWIASQESVDRLAEAVGRIEKILTPVEEPVEPGKDNLHIFKYTTLSDGRLSMDGFVTSTDDMGEYNDVYVYNPYTIDGQEYEIIQFRNLVNGNFINPNMTSFIIADEIRLTSNGVYSIPKPVSYYDMTNKEWLYSSNLKYLDLSKLIIMDGTSLAQLCYEGSSLETVKLEFSQPVVVAPSCVSMFAGCSKLKTLDLTHIDFSKVTNFSNAFKDCSSLTEIKVKRGQWIPDTATTTDMFLNCGVSEVTFVD